MNNYTTIFIPQPDGSLKPFQVRKWLVDLAFVTTPKARVNLVPKKKVRSNAARTRSK